ncbi:E3 ubiquitin-protein ligase RMA1-like [Rutidosis leptorrhynchoides]|uniref:E3 ubiquitin-protein ligase RMA1-like n=1 Tax=Rutidosis leptorrhynchoides TaxID=125765 RepID=UPI003A98D931
MAIEQNYFESEACFELDDDCSLKQKFSPISTSSKTLESEKGSFDCNICLDSASDPVVSLCGHLYCWPCIYKWLYNESPSTKENKQKGRHCPVCKANLNDSSFIPLYCHGKSDSDSDSKSGSIVPRRPPPSRLNTSANSMTSAFLPNQQRLPPYIFQSQPHQQSFPHAYGGMHSSNIMGTTMASLVNPTIGIFREMFLTRVVRTSNEDLFTYPTVQPILTGVSPRMRRHEMQLDKSLNRVWIFLMCFVILCLLTF